jgi:AAA domain
MKIRRLHVTDFAAIREADVEFGAGLNVLHGPNDLGKSTLADAIRLALLLPHTSSHIEDYVPWTGGRNPVVELTFETEAQRIWRVKKDFRKGGASILQESKNGVDFDDVERARGVDAKLREILCWGVQEPGGARGSKGLPESFLATALLSTQADVTAVLSNSLSGDPSGSGRERIAAALQAVAQDPLFVSLLRQTQARRDQAYTEKGAKKTAKGSVFKEAADRVREVRDDKERLQRLVEDSEGIEQQLRALTANRGQREEAVASAMERVKTLEQLAAEAAVLSAAAEHVRLAREEVERIQGIDRDVLAAERNVKDLALKMVEAEEAFKTAQRRLDNAKVALEAAERGATAAGSDSSTRDTVARQALELRRIAAEQAGREAQRRIDVALAAQTLVDVAESAASEYQKQEAEAEAARTVLRDAAAKDQHASEQLRRLDLLERALETRAAEEQAAIARTSVEQAARLRARLQSETRERDSLAARGAAITIPAAASLGPMRRLANDLAGARGALNVGFVVTVTLQRPVDVRVQKDGTAPETTIAAEPMEIEANAEVDIGIGDVAEVRIRGGRRQAQETARGLEKRWSDEVAPHLAAAGVDDLDRLAAKVEDAQALDAAVKLKDAELESLRGQLTSLADSAEKLSATSDRVDSCRAALGDVSLDSLASDLLALGTDPITALRGRRRKLTGALDTARAAAAKAATDFTLAEERRRTSQAALEAAIVARETELTKFAASLIVELSAARAAAAAASTEEKTIATDVASFEHTIAEQRARTEAAVSGARAAVERARAELELAEGARTAILKAHAAEGGRLEALRKQRDSLDLQRAEMKLREASDRHGALPRPGKVVTDVDVRAARNAEAAVKADLDRIVSEIHKTHGALEQVGGAVARERLRDAIEAFDLAERHEREIEADYEAWLLLLQQMKEADAAQASNLGQVLAPAIAAKFEALTLKRYENVRLTAQLGTEGIVVGGALRAAERLSVGTREQLSTLYRLSLAEYLGTTVVLDDQLVQSDVTRLDWFRALLAEKARAFQIIVFTCRPTDYLPKSAIAAGKSVFKDTDGGFVRATALERAIQRR